MFADPYMQERRGADRSSVNWYARVRAQGATATTAATVRNVSISGVFVETLEQYKIGTTLQLAVRVPTYQEVKVIVLTATVMRHVFLADMRGHGYGAQIETMNETDRAIYEQKLSELARI